MEILLDDPSKKEAAVKNVSTEKEDKLERKFPEEEDEEILKESNSRFVLFPIKYREVSCLFLYPDVNLWVDMASVQSISS